MEKRLLTVRDVAQMLSTTEKAVYTLVQRRRIPYRKFGKRLVFLREDLEEFLRSLPKEEPFRS